MEQIGSVYYIQTKSTYMFFTSMDSGGHQLWKHHPNQGEEVTHGNDPSDKAKWCRGFFYQIASYFYRLSIIGQDVCRYLRRRHGQSGEIVVKHGLIPFTFASLRIGMCVLGMVIILDWYPTLQVGAFFLLLSIERCSPLKRISNHTSRSTTGAFRVIR